jgi:hypothetical protein
MNSPAGGSTLTSPFACCTVRCFCRRASSFCSALARSPTSSSHEHVRKDISATVTSDSTDATIPAEAMA